MVERMQRLIRISGVPGNTVGNTRMGGKEQVGPARWMYLRLGKSVIQVTGKAETPFSVKKGYPGQSLFCKTKDKLYSFKQQQQQ